MSKPAIDKVRVKQLIAQDPEINQDRMKEVRMQLEHTLEMSEAKAAQTRRRIVILLAVYWAVTGASWYALSFIGNASVDPKMIRLKELVLIPLNFSAILAFVILVLLVLLYLFKYWPRVSRTRYEIQTAMILELQEQVRELSATVNGSKQ
ncbi:MAG TPA: hypothetical protein VH107_06180 [Lacipirellulaceae bacterium]|nr:hypothetical protein [Lacipirellulaceae bacterium]